MVVAMPQLLEGLGDSQRIDELLKMCILRFLISIPELPMHIDG